MSTTIDPQKQGKISTGSFEKKVLTSGNKIFAPVGVSYIKPKDKIILEVCCICIKDLEGKGEEGIIHTEKFWITDKALWRIANWALSMRNEAAFDCESAQSIEAIFAKGVCFVGNVEIKIDGQYRNVNIRSFSVPSSLIKDGTLTLTNEMSNYIEQGEEAFPKIISKRREWGVNFLNMNSSDDNVVSIHDEIPF